MDPPENSDAHDQIDQLRSPLTRFARAMGLPHHDAEDAAQETLVRLHHALETDRPSIENPKAYAFTILRNLAKKQFARKFRYPEVELKDHHLQKDTPESDKYQNADLKNAFRTAYDALEPAEQELLRKHYVEGKTYEALGKEMGTSTQNAWKICKKIVSIILAGNVRRELTKLDPQFAAELFRNR